MNSPLETKFTKDFNLKTPIIAGPMFLVSDENLVCEVGKYGAMGGTPSLNWRTSAEFQKAIQNIKSKLSNQAFAVNLIVNQANPRVEKDLEICAEEKVPLVITSLGNPKKTIEKMHKAGCKVYCDVVNLEYAKKVEDLGADGVIAVSQGAGGHPGPLSPLVLIPHLKKHLKIPVIAAGGVATGTQMAALILLGADGVQIGTRFIASKEAKVDESYKNAICEALPEDIVLTYKISGTPASVIKTPYIEKVGTEINPLEKILLKNQTTKKWTKLIRSYVGSEKLRAAVSGSTWKEVWSAGQGAGLIDEVLSVEEIIHSLTNECMDCLS